MSRAAGLLEGSFALQAGALALEVALAADARGLVIVGPNGAGKTTTLLALLGVRRPQRGHVRVDGEPLFDAAAGIDVPPERRRIAYVPQDYGLFPHLSALENVAFALGCGPAPPARGDRRARARALLASLGIERVAATRPASLSGGERQRVALARALAIGPRAFFLDEPFAALDVEARGEVRAFLRAQLAAQGRPYVVVTHDPDDVAAFDAPIVVLEAGRVVQRGPRAELELRPATPFVRAFFAPRARGV